MSSPSNWERRLIWGIAAAVLAWGIYHAVGAFLLNYNPWRPVVVLSCVLMFLGGWWLLLRSRRDKSGASSAVAAPAEENR